MSLQTHPSCVDTFPNGLHFAHFQLSQVCPLVNLIESVASFFSYCYLIDYKLLWNCNSFVLQKKYGDSYLTIYIVSKRKVIISVCNRPEILKIDRPGKIVRFSPGDLNNGKHGFLKIVSSYVGSGLFVCPFQYWGNISSK